MTDGITALEPGLAVALDTTAMTARLGVDVLDASVVRHKAGRRCLIRYETSDGPMLGKLRPGHRPHKAVELMQRFRDAGFTEASIDGVAVAEPIAAYDDVSMWVQRVAPGVPADTLIDRAASAVDVAERAAVGARKIHAAGIEGRRHHELGDELRIIEQRLGHLATRRADLAPRLDALWASCRARAHDADTLTERGGPQWIHRDFYADQLIVDGTTTTIVDFDLYCRSDPAIDIGNLVAHLTEHALRIHDDPSALAPAEAACVERFVAEMAARAAASMRRAISAYADLTLARLVGLTVVVDGRSHTTDRLLAVAEQRMTR